MSYAVSKWDWSQIFQISLFGTHCSEANTLCFPWLTGAQRKILIWITPRWCWNIVLSAHQHTTSWHTAGSRSSRPGPLPQCCCWLPPCSDHEQRFIKENLHWDDFNCSNIFKYCSFHLSTQLNQQISTCFLWESLQNTVCLYVCA